MTRGEKGKGPVAAHAIEQFIEKKDDLALELWAKRTMVENGWWSNHGWFYRDPLQDKFRQFDVQGGVDRKVSNLPKTGVRMAVECKNIDPSRSPIVVSRVPRAENEAFHCLIKWTEPYTNYRNVRVVRSGDLDPKPYHVGSPVGKSILQYTDNESATLPEDPFAKWSQALASCSQVVERAGLDASQMPSAPTLCFVFPALVVPDDALWVVDYDQQGNRGAAARADDTTYFVGREYSVTADIGYYIASHLHIFTKTGFVRALKTFNSAAHGQEFDRVYKAGLDEAR